MTKQVTVIPVQKGKSYKVEVTGLGHSGEGVGRYEGFTVFVPGALPGETVVAAITEVKKNYAKGVLSKVLMPSPDRVEPLCALFHRCGGCQLQHLSYAAQLTVKRQQVVDAIMRIGKLDGVVVHPTLPAPNPWYYRNKMQFPVGLAGNRAVVGCYAQGTHDIVDTEHCYIQHQANNIIAAVMRDVVNKLGIATYDERTGKGVIRHILGRVGTATGEVMAVIVTATRELPHRERLIAKLTKAVPGLVSIVQNINPKRTNVILGEETSVIWGKETITDRLGGFVFQISARSFFQVNTEQTVRLYNKAVEYAGLTGVETAIDAYCGTGTITLFLAKRAAKVYGIEVVEPAVRDAWLNARRNGVDNVDFIVGDAVDVMPKLYKSGVRPQAIVVDPPRAGCDRRVLETFVRMQPDRIVYVSCNPASLARDLAVLAECGYMTREIQPVDMFPQTSHIECVVSLKRKHSE
ncbi:RNA methyltransferase, TrmA family [Thermosinus carboxydivorans Nor1]|uniref:RNA methyltransferase, TrmA family n=1 Tax=Thermosinus carboxydivorans Nor1 TaxID=401526 RepID=A1HME1_9FIRM|nr:23S rRNA (uracil(1939)-C(5))-methyltransferase RlmD [Thermosinus carboxydivorans]EAX48981.1 RNA methyltransferase, TrmA family [Thermosinus carboxydivorans Nor1]